MSASRYQSKVDWWLAAILILSMLLMLGSLVTIARQVEREPSLVVASIAIMLGIGLIAWVGLATYYTVDEETLEIVSGPFRWRIPIAAITAVEPTRCPLSAPAMSLDRLRIRYGQNRAILVSPKDREAFLGNLGHDKAVRG